MDEAMVVERAMSIPGATFPQEVRHLYRLALQAPSGTQYVELGTYQGRTLVALAYAAQQKNGYVVSIDNYQYDEAGSKPSSLEIVQNNLVTLDPELDDFYTLIEGNSTDVPFFIEDVGLLFVDSTHTKAHFDAEMEVWLDRVVKGGIIACHDFDSPRWLEMTAAIRAWFNNGEYEYLGLGRRMIGYKKL